MQEPYRGAIVHPLAASLVILLDWLWTPGEAGFTLSGVGIVALPIAIMILATIGFIGVFLVQKFIAKDTIGESVAKAFVMAVVAGVPFPVAGTAIGFALLGTAGINLLRGKT